jgi:hypothetical protein
VTNPTPQQLTEIGYKDLKQVYVTDLIKEFDEIETEIIQYVLKHQEVDTIIQVISIRQGCLALEEYGLLETFEAIISTLDKKAQITWQRSTEILRYNELVVVVCKQIRGMTDKEIDEMFLYASTL